MSKRIADSNPVPAFEETAAMHDERIESLLAFARSLGISDAKVIPVDRLVVDDRFRTYCEEPRCPNYGTSINCPPHSMTPSQFRNLMTGFTKALAFKFDFPHEALQGPERREASLLLHESTAALEHKARSLGFDRACGYSSGGCKNTFCTEYADCAALQQGGRCRYPDKARPSLSGMGLSWHEVSRSLGWIMHRTEQGTPSPESETIMITGLVFLE